LLTGSPFDEGRCQKDLVQEYLPESLSVIKNSFEAGDKCQAWLLEFPQKQFSSTSKPTKSEVSLRVDYLRGLKLITLRYDVGSYQK